MVGHCAMAKQTLITLEGKETWSLFTSPGSRPLGDLVLSSLYESLALFLSFQAGPSPLPSFLQFNFWRAVQFRDQMKLGKAFYFH